MMTRNPVVVPISIAKAVTATMHPMEIVLVAIAVVLMMKVLAGMFIAAARRGFHTYFLLAAISITAEALTIIPATKVEPTITHPMEVILVAIAVVALAEVKVAVVVVVGAKVVEVIVVEALAGAKVVAVVLVAVFELKLKNII